MSKKKLLSKVSALNNSLDELEEKLELILSKPLDDTISGLETLQQTKLLVLLPYIINDLIFSKIANIPQRLNYPDHEYKLFY